MLSSPHNAGMVAGTAAAPSPVSPNSRPRSRPGTGTSGVVAIGSTTDGRPQTGGGGNTAFSHPAVREALTTRNQTLLHPTQELSLGVQHVDADLQQDQYSSTNDGSPKKMSSSGARPTSSGLSSDAVGRGRGSAGVGSPKGAGRKGGEGGGGGATCSDTTTFDGTTTIPRSELGSASTANAFHRSSSQNANVLKSKVGAVSPVVHPPQMYNRPGAPTIQNVRNIHPDGRHDGGVTSGTEPIGVMPARSISRGTASKFVPHQTPAGASSPPSLLGSRSSHGREQTKRGASHDRARATQTSAHGGGSRGSASHHGPSKSHTRSGSAEPIVKIPHPKPLPRNLPGQQRGLAARAARERDTATGVSTGPKDSYSMASLINAQVPTKDEMIAASMPKCKAPGRQKRTMLPPELVRCTPAQRLAALELQEAEQKQQLRRQYDLIPRPTGGFRQKKEKPLEVNAYFKYYSSEADDDRVARALLQLAPAVQRELSAEEQEALQEQDRKRELSKASAARKVHRRQNQGGQGQHHQSPGSTELTDGASPGRGSPFTSSPARSPGQSPSYAPSSSHPSPNDLKTATSQLHDAVGVVAGGRLLDTGDGGASESPSSASASVRGPTAAAPRQHYKSADAPRRRSVTELAAMIDEPHQQHARRNSEKFGGGENTGRSNMNPGTGTGRTGNAYLGTARTERTDGSPSKDTGRGFGVASTGRTQRTVDESSATGSVHASARRDDAGPDVSRACGVQGAQYLHPSDVHQFGADRSGTSLMTAAKSSATSVPAEPSSPSPDRSHGRHGLSYERSGRSERSTESISAEVDAPAGELDGALRSQSQMAHSMRTHQRQLELLQKELQRTLMEDEHQSEQKRKRYAGMPKTLGQISPGCIKRRLAESTTATKTRAGKHLAVAAQREQEAESLAEEERTTLGGTVTMTGRTAASGASSTRSPQRRRKHKTANASLETTGRQQGQKHDQDPQEEDRGAKKRQQRRDSLATGAARNDDEDEDVSLMDDDDASAVATPRPNGRRANPHSTGGEDGGGGRGSSRATRPRLSLTSPEDLVSDPIVRRQIPLIPTPQSGDPLSTVRTDDPLRSPGGHSSLGHSSSAALRGKESRGYALGTATTLVRAGDVVHSTSLGATDAEDCRGLRGAAPLRKPGSVHRFAPDEGFDLTGLKPKCARQYVKFEKVFHHMREEDEEYMRFCRRFLNKDGK